MNWCCTYLIALLILLTLPYLIRVGGGEVAEIRTRASLHPTGWKKLNLTGWHPFTGGTPGKKKVGQVLDGYMATTSKVDPNITMQ